MDTNIEVFAAALVGSFDKIASDEEDESRRRGIRSAGTALGAVGGGLYAHNRYTKAISAGAADHAGALAKWKAGNTAERAKIRAMSPRGTPTTLATKGALLNHRMNRKVALTRPVAATTGSVGSSGHWGRVLGGSALGAVGGNIAGRVIGRVLG
jgi:hypothetical protein